MLKLPRGYEGRSLLRSGVWAYVAGNGRWPRCGGARNWNADEVRSVRTLSGGETFLASLALGLGLAEGLPKLSLGEHDRQQLESLFIDEGFGTLDTDETLGSVAQALENLQSGNRLVGIVTHVKGLADRLPAQIRVVKTQTGSHLEAPAE